MSALIKIVFILYYFPVVLVFMPKFFMPKFQIIKQ